MIHIPSRRDLLRGGAGLAMASALPGISLAQSAKDTVFIFIILRGGLDGLVAAVPYGDPHYAKIRGANAFDAADLTDLDGFYGLPPALRKWRPLWRDKELLIVHALGNPYDSRSHFDAQEVLEIGFDRPKGNSGGWMARALNATGASGEALAVTPGLPLVLRGATPPMTWYPSWVYPPERAEDYMQQLDGFYKRDPVLGPVYRKGMDLRSIVSSTTTAPESETMMGHPDRGLRFSSPQEAASVFSDLARIINTGSGPNTAVMELGSWDTHSVQGVKTGALADLMTNLAEGILALKDTLGSTWSNTVVAIATEFGRTAEFNGSAGTDHGTGMAAYLVGGNVNGGRVVADWPGLARRNLYQERDLAVTLDIRAMFKGIAHEHLKVSSHDLDTKVFPNSAGITPMRDLVRG